jgi:membrane-associated HD superfamily phosphohydrolase
MKTSILSDLIRRASNASASKRPSGAAGAGRPATILSSLDWPQFFLTVITIVLLSALMTVNLIPDRVSLHKGEVSRREVRASRTVFYVNNVKTGLNQQAARLNARPVYDRDERAAANAVRIAQEFFVRVEAERSLASRRSPSRAAALDQSVARLQQAYGSLSRAQLQSLLTISPGLLQKMHDIAVGRIRMAMSMDIHDRYDLAQP